MMMMTKGAWPGAWPRPGSGSGTGTECSPWDVWVRMGGAGGGVRGRGHCWGCGRCWGVVREGGVVGGVTGGVAIVSGCGQWGCGHRCGQWECGHYGCVPGGCGSEWECPEWACLSMGVPGWACLIVGVSQLGVSPYGCARVGVAHCGPGWAWLIPSVPRPPPGLPNAGKSSVLNALLGRSAVGVSRAPGRTRYFQTHYLTAQVRLCDCPGLVFPSRAPPELQVRDKPPRCDPQTPPGVTLNPPGVTLTPPRGWCSLHGPHLSCR